MVSMCQRLGTFAHVTIYYLTHTKLYGIKIFRQNIRFKALSVIAMCSVVKIKCFPSVVYSFTPTPLTLSWEAISYPDPTV